LAVRLPSAVVEALDLKEGEQIEIRIAGSREFEIARDRSVDEALERIGPDSLQLRHFQAKGCPCQPHPNSLLALKLFSGQGIHFLYPRGVHKSEQLNTASCFIALPDTLLRETGTGTANLWLPSVVLLISPARGLRDRTAACIPLLASWEFSGIGHKHLGARAKQHTLDEPGHHCFISVLLRARFSD
jgi:hypothetical protein